MALVGKPALLRNQSNGQTSLTQQAFGALDPALNDIALRSNPSRQLERAAEVIRAQTGNVGQHGERKIAIEMRLDEIARSLQRFR